MRHFAAILFFFTAFSASGQLDLDRRRNLDKIQLESAANNEIQSNRALEYARKNNIPLFYTDGIRTTRMVGVNDFGIPIYVSTDNANAAITTNVIALQKGNPLGLNLEGNGMKAAIWDGGSIAHVEFGNRIISTEGTASDHSNHVAGTIMAQGMNLLAKGMAPKATLVSFDFNNDISEMAIMAKPDQTSLLLSNHSYGFVTGWDCPGAIPGSCQWRGSAGISSLEDYRFGFYTSSTRSWDLIANNAPYYTIVKSAGNDRQSGSGNGFPADCNGGSGYDCLEEQATAKNILTIGAVNKVLNYTQASDVVMSSFSGWGPTDDGRIKPDLVGDGVSVFSTVTNNLYGSLSGTSMSSPNVMGSLVLIQELYRNLNGGNFMLSSTVKALAIHTAKEAGQNPGPDYQFGWGLLDVGNAGSVLVNIDNQNVYVLERELKNLEVFELPLTPKANQKITATLVWNDPAGTPPGASLDPTNLMLVNDLDMRLIDDQGNTQFPWTLDPTVGSLGSPAFKADNFRDNVEKIEFDNPALRPYKIRITHKNTLASTQKYSLVVTYSSIQDPPQKLYWVGNSGNWDDAAHWSASSGGSAGSLVPSDVTKAIFDENSFTADGTVTFANPAICQSLLLLASSEKISFDLSEKTLSLSGDFITTDSIFSVVSPGNFQFSGSGSVNINNANLSKVNFSFDGNSFKLQGKGKLGQVALKKGSLDMSNTNFQIGNLNASTSGTKTLNIKNATISGLGLSSLNVADNLVLQTDSATIRTQTAPSQFNWSGINLTGNLVMTNPGTLTITGNNQILRAAINGSLSLNGNNQFTNFSMTPGSTLILSNNSVQSMTKKTVIQSSSNLKVNLQSPGHAKLNFDGKFKLCFDFLNISEVELMGSASINAGLNSTLVNSPNWFQENCQDVILPDFVVSFPCSGGQTKFTDSSQGLVTGYAWKFTGSSIVATGINSNIALAKFPAPGTYQVQLTASNSKYTKILQQDVIIGANDLNENSIVVNGFNLFSQEFAPSYQWIKNDVAIPGATQRSYLFNGQAGSYTILTSNTNCNRISPVFTITGMEEDESKELRIFPNPAKNMVNITTGSPDEMNISFLNMMGQTVGRFHLGLHEQLINTAEIPAGMYIVLIEQENRKFFRKLMIAK